MSDVLSEWEGRWRTELGAWFPGERVVLRGRDVMSDIGRERWMGMLLYGITGRHFTLDQVRLFEGIWSLGGSFPDPRLWNNRVAALTASARSSSALGVGAAIAVTEAIVYGHRPSLATMVFVQRCVDRVRAGEDVRAILTTALANKPVTNSGGGKNREVASIPGFGRPITTRDERLEALYALASELGFRDGEHVRMLERMQNTLLDMGHKLYLNAAGLAGALVADQGLQGKEYYHFMILGFGAGMVPCAIDALENPEGAFFPLRCENIRYEGAAPRRWQDCQ